VFSPQGAGSVPDVVPLPDRGSYGQVVEPLAGGTLPASAVRAASSEQAQVTALPDTGSGLPSPAGVVALAGLLLLRRRRRRGPRRG